MSVSYPDPSSIMQLATGYWNSATLLTAVEIGLFSVLKDGPLTNDVIAQRLSMPVRSLTLLLDACVGLELLEKVNRSDASAYQNPPNTEAFLVAGRPGYLGSALQWSADQYRAWGRLTESVRSNAPAVPPALHLGEDPEQTRRFVVGMQSRALGMARGVLPFLDLTGAQTLLDVGGGPAAYATLLAQQYPLLHVSVLDLPDIVAIAQELVSKTEVAARILFLPGDATRNPYGEAEYDAILFSGVLHQMSPPTIQAMFKKAWQALRPGGKLLISDMMLDTTKTQPPFAALFSLQMLLTSAEGAVFAAEECTEWLLQTGFHDIVIRPLPPPLPYTVITAFRKDSL